MKFIKKNNFQRYEDLLQDEILNTEELSKIKGGIRKEKLTLKSGLESGMVEEDEDDITINVKGGASIECYITGTGGNCHIFDRE
jgi:hypothetical protein